MQIHDRVQSTNGVKVVYLQDAWMEETRGNNLHRHHSGIQV